MARLNTMNKYDTILNNDINSNISDRNKGIKNLQKYSLLTL